MLSLGVVGGFGKAWKTELFKTCPKVYDSHAPIFFVEQGGETTPGVRPPESPVAPPASETHILFWPLEYGIFGCLQCELPSVSFFYVPTGYFTGLLLTARPVVAPA